jgi:CTP synthase
VGNFIIVVGGVYSGTGKGIGAASIGLLLKMRGASVQLIKCDPYLNINAGTMNPNQHGEVFLCNDGSETDLDLGHYERITGIEMSGRNIFTSGTLYKELIEQEEQGSYLGQTVQIIPHVTDMIQQRLLKLGEEADIVIAEIGGTVGDIESMCFFEAIRQFKQTYPNQVMILMVAPIIWDDTVKELKTKPLQNSVKTLQSFGLQPEMLLCRCSRPVSPQLLDKVSRLTNVNRACVFEAPTVSTIYEVPIEYWNRHIDDVIADKFHLRRNGCRIHKYKELVEMYTNGHDLPKVKIGVVGKYENGDEAYMSLKEALMHAGIANNAKVEIAWMKAEQMEEAKDGRGLWRYFDDCDGVIVPGGFDKRGVEGKLKAVNYVREKKIPFLGICLGLQCATIEFARNVLKLPNATSEEFNKDAEHKVVHYIAGQENITKKAGTMRLGAYECELEKDSLVHQLYKKKNISERHRHRYEVNDKYVKDFEARGFKVSGRNPESKLVEMMELDRKQHPFFVGTQAHPEFKSRLGEPSPLFDGLIQAALVYKNARESKGTPVA